MLVREGKYYRSWLNSSGNALGLAPTRSPSYENSSSACAQVTFDIVGFRSRHAPALGRVKRRHYF